MEDKLFLGKEKSQGLEIVPLSWVSRMRRNSKLLLIEAPKCYTCVGLLSFYSVLINWVRTFRARRFI